MEKLYFEIPSIARKEDAIDYIREFHEYQSDINGTGGLDRFIDNYEGWLEKLEQDYTRIPNEEKVPARTFFLVRDTDRKIVGMINIRLCLNERLSHYGGHMGYSIRPTERGKGDNKLNLLQGVWNKPHLVEDLLDGRHHCCHRSFHVAADITQH